jgi:hypothetical protein
VAVQLVAEPGVERGVAVADLEVEISHGARI